MRGRVDAARQAAHDRDASRGEVRAKPLRGFERDGGRGARADDGDRGRAAARRASRDTRVPAARRTWRAARRETADRPTPGRGSPPPRRAAARLAPRRAAVRAISSRHGIVGAQPFGETDAGKLGNERQRDGLIKCHEGLLPGKPGCARREEAENTRGRTPRRGTRGCGTRPRCPDYRQSICRFATRL